MAKRKGITKQIRRTELLVWVKALRSTANWTADLTLKQFKKNDHYAAVSTLDSIASEIEMILSE